MRKLFTLRFQRGFGYKKHCQCNFQLWPSQHTQKRKKQLDCNIRSFVSSSIVASGICVNFKTSFACWVIVVCSWVRHFTVTVQCHFSLRSILGRNNDYRQTFRGTRQNAVGGGGGWSKFWLDIDSNSELVWVCFTLVFDWSRKLAPFSKPIKFQLSPIAT